jgi:hypothetical protein
VDVIRAADLAEVDGAEHDGLFIAQEHDTECQQGFADTDGGFNESTAQRSANGWCHIGSEGGDLDREGGGGGEEKEE